MSTKRISFSETPCGGSDCMLTAEHWERLKAEGWVQTGDFKGYLDCERRAEASQSFERATGFNENTMTCMCCGENFAFFDGEEYISWWEWDKS